MFLVAALGFCFIKVTLHLILFDAVWGAVFIRVELD